MTEQELLAKWAEEEPIYRAWGQRVAEEVERVVGLQNASIDFSTFLKIPAAPRTKKGDSLLGKAFHRGKAYEDPYADITDKVGVRFVVLLSSEISILKRAVEQSDLWIARLDRDFEEEREKRPTEFAYQSLHFVVRAREDVDYMDVRIPAGTPCEIQIRTLLQHAHSELTHDNIYKVQTGTVVSSRVHRTIAKSMALIETVDDFFESALAQLTEATKPERDALLTLARFYEQEVGYPPGNDQANQIVVHAVIEALDANLIDQLRGLIAEKPYVIERIRERHASHLAFRQPWVLLAYLLAARRPEWLMDRWPLTREEIGPIYTDVGAAA